MYNLIKINRTEFTNIYFNSDNHRNHNRDFLYGPRGFKNISEHDEWLDSHFFNLKSTDLVIMLGDNALNSSCEETLNWFKKIPAKKLIIFGNHSSWDYPIYKESLKNWSSQYTNSLSSNKFELFPLSINSNSFRYGISERSDKFQKIDVKEGYINNMHYDMIFLGYEHIINIGNIFFYCRHMAPFIFDKMKYENFVCVCGHSHGNCHEINVSTKNFNKILDVGVDNSKKYNGSPFFKYEEVVEIMSYKSINIPDHHGKTE